VSSGATDLISPVGMLQPWHLPMWVPILAAPLDPNGRYPLHYNFVQAAADHFSMTPNWSDLYSEPSKQSTIDLNEQWNHSNYTPTKGAANNEEALVIDDQAIYDTYGPSWDTAPLLDKTDAVVVAGLSEVEIKGSKCIRKHPNRKCRLSLRKRTYHRLTGWENKMACDYAYDLLLRNRPSCSLTASVGTGPLHSGVRTGPNPFRGSMNIDFTIGRRGRVQLDIYDSQGRLVRNLLKQTLDPGKRSLAWDSRSDAGRSLPSGLYLWRLRVDGNEQASGKVLLLH
jgi:hypothetical protein